MEKRKQNSYKIISSFENKELIKEAVKPFRNFLEEYMYTFMTPTALRKNINFALDKESDALHSGPGFGVFAAVLTDILVSAYLVDTKENFNFIWVMYTLPVTNVISLCYELCKNPSFLEKIFRKEDKGGW